MKIEAGEQISQRKTLTLTQIDSLVKSTLKGQNNRGYNLNFENTWGLDNDKLISRFENAKGMLDNSPEKRRNGTLTQFLNIFNYLLDTEIPLDLRKHIFGYFTESVKHDGNNFHLRQKLSGISIAVVGSVVGFSLGLRIDEIVEKLDLDSYLDENTIFAVSAGLRISANFVNVLVNKRLAKSNEVILSSPIVPFTSGWRHRKIAGVVDWGFGVGGSVAEVIYALLEKEKKENDYPGVTEVYNALNIARATISISQTAIALAARRR